jgi:ABC-type bacteriocin/lantibiotic exporter with double-glycine peptidase domain
MKNIVFPKTLLGFYLRYAVRPYLAVTSLFTFLLISVRVAYGLLWPFYNKWFIGLFERPLPPDMTFLEFAMPTILLIVGLMLAANAVDVIQNTLQGRSNMWARNNISVVLYRYVNQQSMMFFYARYPGKIAKQIQYICEGYFPRRIFNIVAAILVLIIGTGFTLMLDWRISGLIGAALVFRLIYGLWRMMPMNKAAHVTSDASSSLSGVNIDSISNFSIVKLFAGAKREEKHAHGYREKFVTANLYQRFAERLFWVIPMFITTLLFGVVLLVCIIRYQSGDMTVAEVVFAQSIFWTVMNQIDGIVDAIPELN